jgi:hypothetical protein
MKKNCLKSKKLPGAFYFFTKITADKVEKFKDDFEIINNSIYSDKLNLNLFNSQPLHAIRYKSPPTSCTTPGKQIPGGLTPSGKWKSAYYRPAKTDKRAGK